MELTRSMKSSKILNRQNRFSHFVILFVNIIFLLILTLAIIVKVLYPFIRLSFNTLSQVALFVGTGLVIVFITILLVYTPTFSNIAVKYQRLITRVKYRNLIFFLFVIALSVRLLGLMLFGVKIYSGGDDSATYLLVSEQLAINGHITEYADYAFTFPHMFVFSIVLLPVVKFVGTANLVVSIYLTVLSCVSLVLLFDTAAYILGRVKSFTFAIIVALLPSQVLLGRTITHEIAFVLFFSLSLWLYFRIIPCVSKKVISYLLYVLFSICLVISALVNAAGIIGMIAFVLYFIFNSFRKDISKKRLLNCFVKLVCIILVYFIINTSLSIIQKNISTLILNNHTNPIIWTLYIGANYNNEGAWDVNSAKDMSEINPVEIDPNLTSQNNWEWDSNLSKSDIDKLQLELVKGRYQYLFNHPSEFVKLMYFKFDNIWHGLFYPLYNDRPSTQSLLNDGLSGKSIYYYLLLSIQFFVELILAVFSLLLYIRENIVFISYENGFIWTIKLFLIGMTIMLLITECREKYIISINAMVILLFLYYFSQYFISYKRNK